MIEFGITYFESIVELDISIKKIVNVLLVLAKKESCFH